jgi:hypothetical protein
VREGLLQDGRQQTFTQKTITILVRYGSAIKIFQCHKNIALRIWWLFIAGKYRPAGSEIKDLKLYIKK